MKKILFVFPSPLVGGIETLFATLLKHLPPGFHYQPVIPQGINQAWVSSNIDNPIFYNQQSFKSDLAKKIQAYDPDLIVGALNYSLSAAMKECKKHYPILETSHNVLESAPYSIKIVRPWLIHVVCVSQSVLTHISKEYKGPSSVILTGIDTERFKPGDQLNPVVRNYAYFGRISEGDKYIRNLFRAFTKMPAVTLNVYGSAHTAKDQTEYNRLVNTEFKNAHIILRGFVTDPEKHLLNNDVMVIRSEAEGFCNAAAEALACGIPLVTYNFGGVLDHLPPRSCLKAQNQAEFEQNLKIIKNFDVRKELRENGLRFINTVGNATNMARQYYTLFCRLLKSDIEIKPVVVEKPKEVFQGKVTAICTPLSRSIQHTMEEFADEVTVAPYGDKKKASPKVSHDIVVVNAAGKNYNDMIIDLAKTKKVYSIYHGSFCSFSFKYYQGEVDNLKSMLDLQKQGHIRKIGFVNEGSALFYKKLGYNTAWMPNIPMDYVGLKDKLIGINIGIFTSEQDIKNSVSAVACALSIPGAIVHTVCDLPPMPGFDKNRIIVHGQQSKENLLKLMSEMQLTMMLSFSESFGLLVTQSWAVGTPCIVGPACKPLLSPDLMALYVERFDDAHKVSETIQYCLINKFDLKTRIKQLREIGFQQREEFFS